MSVRAPMPSNARTPASAASNRTEAHALPKSVRPKPKEQLLQQAERQIANAKSRSTLGALLVNGRITGAARSPITKAQTLLQRLIMENNTLAASLDHAITQLNEAKMSAQRAPQAGRKIHEAVAAFFSAIKDTIGKGAATRRNLGAAGTIVNDVRDALEAARLQEAENTAQKAEEAKAAPTAPAPMHKAVATQVTPQKPVAIAAPAA